MSKTVAYEKTIQFHWGQGVTLSAVADAPYAIIDIDIIDADGGESSLSLGGVEAEALRDALIEATAKLDAASRKRCGDTIAACEEKP